MPQKPIDQRLHFKNEKKSAMKKTPSILAAAVQLLACAGLFPTTGSAKVDTSTNPNATISQRITRVREAIVGQAKSASESNGIQLTGWGNWHNGWHNGWRNWGNGWRKWWHNW
jgi:hypothetical protein